MKKANIILITFLLIPLAVGCAGGSDNGGSSGTAVEGIGSIQTENYANLNLEYYYYIPASVVENSEELYPVQASVPFFVTVPWINGRGESFVSSTMKQFADEEGFVIVSPSFVYDEANWDAKQSYQYPAVWSGDALLEIIDQVEEQHNLFASDLYLFGFSAGAQFALRFCLWKPYMCEACAAHASGGTVIPTGYIDVAFFVTVGSSDTDRISKAQSFCDTAESYGIDVTYKEYSNVGHTLTQAQIEDSLNFLRNLE